MANTKKRVLSLFMAVMMVITALPMNAIAISISDIAELTCTKPEVAHTAECYVHTEDCYHKHSEPVYVLGKLIYGCEYACTAHTHSTDIGCPVDNCNAHAHDSECCGIEEHKHGVLCYTLVQTCSHGWQVWKCNDNCYQTVLTCTKNEHDHTTGCNYTCGISTEHTHDADCYSCTIPEHTHTAECKRLCGLTSADLDPLKCNDVTILLHQIDCKNEEHHKHSMEEGCYLPGEAVKDAFYKATGVEITSADEIAAVLSVLLSCKTGCGYKVTSIYPFAIEMQLCEEHFCALCHRLNDGYCTCVEITFANIGNVADSTKTVKVKAGETIDVAEIPSADLLNYRFLGWFDANGNEFNAETVYTEDVTFTAQYKALTEAEKLENTIKFIKNNFNLGHELGRMITILSKGEITKETITNKKDEVLKAVQVYLLTNQLTGKISAEQAQEIVTLMQESDEYTTLFAEWLWPENAVDMPTVDEIMANIDFEKLADEIKGAITEKYGIEFTQEWIDENRALAEQYIAEALEEAKSVSEAQKQLLLEQLEAKKAEAQLIMAMIRCEMVRNIKAEIENVKAYVKDLLANTALGIKTGKNISKLSGLDNKTALKYGAEFKKALIAALAMTELTEDQQKAVAKLINENDGIVVEFIDWLWPTVTVYWMHDGKLLEKDVVAFDETHEYNGEIPTKESTAQYSYEFAGWNGTYDADKAEYTYTAVFADSINCYTITFVVDGIETVKTYAYGEMPEIAEPTKDADAQYTYKFAGWDNEIVPVTGDATYTAIFNSTVNCYTVTWMNGDETLETDVVAYGTMPEYNGATPVKESTAENSYQFTGWDKVIAEVTGDVTYVALFETIVNEYTVTFVDEDGTVLETQTVKYGVTPVYTGATPFKADTAEFDYEFAGFGEITAVTGDVTYTATYTATRRSYTVTFMDGETVLYSEVLPYGTEIVAPELPTKKGWVTKWDTEFSTVTGDLTATVVWEHEYLEVARLKINVGNGTPASGSTKGNALSHWGKIYNVRSYYSYYDYPNYKSDSIMSTDEFDFARTHAEAVPGNVKYDGVVYTNGEGTSDNYYVLTGEYAYVSCKGEYHLDYKATFYNVYTYVVDGVETKVTALQGTDPVAPADPSKDGYEFDGWVMDENGVYNAKFTKIHTVKFILPAGGTKYQTVRDGETIVDWADFVPNTNPEYSFLYWKYETGGVKGTKFDFNAPVTCDVVLRAAQGYTVADRDVALTATYGDETFDLGIATLMNSRHPNAYSKGQNIAALSSFAGWDNFVMPECPAITIDGITYTYGEGSSANYYVVNVDAIMVEKDPSVKKGYMFTAEGAIELYHRVTFYLAVGGSKVFYVRDGEQLNPNWIDDEKDFFSYEVINYWYNSKGGAKLDFATYVVTSNVSFSCKTKDKYGDWDVALKGTLNGETIELGTAVINNAQHAGCWTVGNDKVHRYDIPHDDSQITMPEMQSIVVDGVTYTYGKGSSNNYYTIDFTTLSCYSIKNSRGKVVDWEYHYTGEIELFHNAKVLLTCDGSVRRTVTLKDVAHGTVITTEWMLNNKYLPIGFSLAEDVVINEGIEYRVDWVENN